MTATREIMAWCVFEQHRVAGVNTPLALGTIFRLVSARDLSTGSLSPLKLSA